MRRQAVEDEATAREAEQADAERTRVQQAKEELIRQVRKTPKLAQHLGQLQPFVAGESVSPIAGLRLWL